MNKTSILNILFGIVYYVLGVLGFYIWFIAWLFDNIIGEFSEPIFMLYFAIFPIIILILPIFINKIFKKCFYKAIIIGCKTAIVYVIFILIIRGCIIMYMSDFTIEKWNDTNYYDLRYLMIDSLEQKYNFVGMKKDDVVKILGKGEQRKSSVCYLIKSVWMDSYYYCLHFDENNIITDTYNTYDSEIFDNN